MISNVKELLDSLTPDIYQKLKLSVELGKWPTGGELSKEQRELCLQAVIAYEEKNLKTEDRTGYIPPKKHTHCGSTVGTIANDDTQPLKFDE